MIVLPRHARDKHNISMGNSKKTNRFIMQTALDVLLMPAGTNFYLPTGVKSSGHTCQLTCPFVPSLSWQTIVFRLQIFQRTTRGTNFRAMCCRIQPPLAGRHYLCLSPRQWWHPDCGGADGRRLEERPEARGARFPCRCALRLAAQTTHY